MGRFNWDWSGEGPPDDAYSRVTEPDRFAPLHGWALEAIVRLQTEYEVGLDEDGVTDPYLELRPLSRPLIKLTPVQDSAAPVTVAFTDFPGLGIRAGRWLTDWFPSCGCDACDEMPEDEFEGFTELLIDVVAGRFRESLYLDPRGGAWSSMELWCGEHRRRSGESRVPRDEATQVLNGETRFALEWTPWQPRADGKATL